MIFRWNPWETNTEKDESPAACHLIGCLGASSPQRSFIRATQPRHRQCNGCEWHLIWLHGLKAFQTVIVYRECFKIKLKEQVWMRCACTEDAAKVRVFLLFLTLQHWRLKLYICWSNIFMRYIFTLKFRQLCSTYETRIHK